MTYDINSLTEEEIDLMSPEEQQELANQLNEEESSSSMASPSPEKKDSTLVLFREIIEREDTTKLGFLNKEELGLFPYSVRKLKKISLFADTQHLTELSQYFESQSEIILATSLSFKGKLIDNIVTQIKKDMKISSQPTITKSGWFGSKTINSGDSGDTQ